MLYSIKNIFRQGTCAFYLQDLYSNLTNDYYIPFALINYFQGFIVNIRKEIGIDFLYITNYLKNYCTLLNPVLGFKYLVSIEMEFVCSTYSVPSRESGISNSIFISHEVNCE